jgi:hypothetical protein
MPITISCPGCKSTLRIRDEYAGKAMKCPRCSASLAVPPPDEPVVTAVVEEPAPVVAETAIEEVRPVARRPQKARLIKCPGCGELVPEDARKCRFCRRRLDDEEEEDEREGEDYLPCPQCQARRPERVNWTWWGSYLGPRLCNQVRCRRCEYTYNGLTGGTNLGAKIVFVAVPLVAILGIITALVFILIEQ